jgi:hypothetical protein
VELRFPDHAGQVEWVELVSDFATAAASIVATMDMEDILRNGGKGLRLYLGPFN